MSRYWPGWLKFTVRLIAINAAVLLALLVVVELIFGSWFGSMSLSDLRRFSIPVDVHLTIDTSSLYESAARNPAHYSRDKWGLRGSYRELSEVDVLTVGGSTTEQKYLDDLATWQAVAQRESEKNGHPLVFANAGVDGQSTVGCAFNFRHWFPLLEGLRPRVVLFYVGANDVLRRADRGDYDRAVDATSWRVRSVTYQLVRTIRGNLRARNVGVVHGRMRPVSAADFTEQGLLSAEERIAIEREVTQGYLSRIDGLRQDALAWGAVPIFMTQTAFAWNADRGPPRGLKDTVQIHGRTMNYADVAFLHGSMNRALMEHCAKTNMTCFDMASDVQFDAADYYDFLHNTPLGAEKIGRYLADRLASLDTLRRP